MLNNEEIRRINEVFKSVELEDEEDKKLKTKLELICKQLEIYQKTQEEVAKIQDEIVALSRSDLDAKEEN